MRSKGEANGLRYFPDPDLLASDSSSGLCLKSTRAAGNAAGRSVSAFGSQVSGLSAYDASVAGRAQRELAGLLRAVQRTCGRLPSWRRTG